MEEIIDNVLELYSINIKLEANNILDKLVEKLNDDIKNNISMKIRDLLNYDYSKINIKYDIILSTIDYQKQNCIDYYNGKYFINNEKICIYYYFEKQDHNYGFIKNHCYITNYGRLLFIEEKQNKYNNSCGITYDNRIIYCDERKKEDIINYNIWLPLDYIELINMSKPEKIYNIMEKISKDLCFTTHTNIDNTIQILGVGNTKLMEQNDILNKDLIKINVKYNKIEELYTKQNNKYEKIKNIINDK